MKRIKEVTNFLHQSIKVIIDCSTRNSNNRLPDLDTELWLKAVNNRVQVFHPY